MQIDLPAELIERANQLATAGQDASAVIGEAIDALEAERGEVAAVRAGIAAYQAGDWEPLDDFDREFRRRHGLSPDA